MPIFSKSFRWMPKSGLLAQSFACREQNYKTFAKNEYFHSIWPYLLLFSHVLLPFWLHLSMCPNPLAPLPLWLTWTGVLLATSEVKPTTSLKNMVTISNSSGGTGSCIFSFSATWNSKFEKVLKSKNHCRKLGLYTVKPLYIDHPKKRCISISYFGEITIKRFSISKVKQFRLTRVKKNVIALF